MNELNFERHRTIYHISADKRGLRRIAEGLDTFSADFETTTAKEDIQLFLHIQELIVAGAYVSIWQSGEAHNTLYPIDKFRKIFDLTDLDHFEEILEETNDER